MKRILSLNSFSLQTSLCLGLFCLTFGSVKTFAEAVTAPLARQALAELPAENSFKAKFIRASLERTFHDVAYVPAYVRISYPNGDVPANTGVCTDEIIRAYRELGIDLQKLVHEDMRQNFRAYPKNWGLSKPDPNIDHRRVPNLRTFFKRKGASLAVTDKPENYQPGDIITSTVPPNLPHIALVVPAPDGSKTPWIVHNIGRGPQFENALFTYPITGHYRWHPES